MTLAEQLESGKESIRFKLGTTVSLAYRLQELQKEKKKYTAEIPTTNSIGIFTNYNWMMIEITKLTIILMQVNSHLLELPIQKHPHYSGKLTPVNKLLKDVSSFSDPVFPQSPSSQMKNILLNMITKQEGELHVGWLPLKRRLLRHAPIKDTSSISKACGVIENDLIRVDFLATKLPKETLCEIVEIFDLINNQLTYLHKLLETYLSLYSRFIVGNQPQP